MPCSRGVMVPHSGPNLAGASLPSRRLTVTAARAGITSPMQPRPAPPAVKVYKRPPPDLTTRSVQAVFLFLGLPGTLSLCFLGAPVFALLYVSTWVGMARVVAPLGPV